jgi:ATP-dependent helicase/DNAse subunit B
MHYGDPLANNPAVIAFLNLLELTRFNFRRRDVLDVLRSPYFAVPDMDEARINQIDMISREQYVIRGRQDWLDAIRSASISAVVDEDGEMHDALLSSEDGQRIHASLTAFFEAVTPPETGTINDYVAWIEALIGNDTIRHVSTKTELELEVSSYSLQTINCVRQAGEPYASRDLVALQAVKRVLRGMLATQRLFTVLKLPQAEQMTWEAFLSDFKGAVAASSVDNNTNRSGRVLITTVSDARGLPHDHVFIPGLSEGIFPRPVPEDPIYLDSERQALTEAGILLETQAERAADEGLFFELISLPRKTLNLSRPTIQNGAIWPESHLWRAVKVMFSDAETILDRYRIPLGSVMKAEDAANRSEATLAVATYLNQEKTEDAAASMLHNWLHEHHKTHWQDILHNRQIEYDRQNSTEIDRYSGKLSDRRLIDWVGSELGEKRIWSASQFNDYGMCGFRFFAKRLLKLEEIEEPETGMDAAQRGTVIHAILEETYRELAQRGLSITLEHMGDALDILQQVAALILPNAPERYGFRASVLWRQEQETLMRKVESLVRSDFSDESPLGKLYKGERFAYFQEVPLGGKDSVPLKIRIGGDVLKVTGYIDRIDRIGNQIIVVDYKTGSTKIPTSEMTEGRNFQMMLYLLAGQAILKRAQESDTDAPLEVAGGTFWHLNQTTSGAIHMDDPDDQEAIDTAQMQLTAHLEQGRVGNFASVPNKKGGGACSHYCEFTQLCRVNIMNRQKRA